VAQIIDLRRFLRAGDDGVLCRFDGVPLDVRYEHVTTACAEASTNAGSFVIGDAVRGEVRSRGVRLAVAFDVRSVRTSDSAAVLELALADAIVLGDRRAARFAARGTPARVLHDAGGEEHEVRLLDVSRGGVGFAGAAATFSPGDELVLGTHHRAALGLRVQVVRRDDDVRGSRYGCRVLIERDEDAEILIRLCTA